MPTLRWKPVEIADKCYSANGLDRVCRNLERVFAPRKLPMIIGRSDIGTLNVMATTVGLHCGVNEPNPYMNLLRAVSENGDIEVDIIQD